MPNANLGQDASSSSTAWTLLPDNMGGDVPFVETSAVTGKGIDELLDTISLVAELKELKANPNKPAAGHLPGGVPDRGRGRAWPRCWSSEGTLHARRRHRLRGQPTAASGAMYDDLGRPIEEAGPSVPVRITGLDEVPNADDPFHVVAELAKAREIAEKRKEQAAGGGAAAGAARSRLETLGAKAEDHRAEGDPQGRGPRLGRGDPQGAGEARRTRRCASRVLHAGIGGHHRERRAAGPDLARRTR